MGMALIFIFLFLLSSISSSYGYDSLDPDANITITWDLMLDNGNTYDLRVLLYNFQLFRHVERPGWKLSWTWKWTRQYGICGEQRQPSKETAPDLGVFLPHCCEKQPVIVDLMPGARYNKQYSNCCKGGLLSSMTQDPSMSAAAFRMNVNKASAGNINGDSSFMPMNFNLGLPGYTCGDPFQVPPTMFKEDGSRRWTQALGSYLGSFLKIFAVLSLFIFAFGENYQHDNWVRNPIHLNSYTSQSVTPATISKYA